MLIATLETASKSHSKPVIDALLVPITTHAMFNPSQAEVRASNFHCQTYSLTPHFMFHVSCFMFHVSCFMFHVSCFMFHVLTFKPACCALGWLLAAGCWLLAVLQVVCAIIKPLASSLQSYLFAELVRRSQLPRTNASDPTGGGWNDSTFVVLSSILGAAPAPAIDPTTASSFVAGLTAAVTITPALRASTKLVALLSSFVRSFPTVAKPLKQSLQSMLQHVTAWTAKAVVAAVGRL